MIDLQEFERYKEMEKLHRVQVLRNVIRGGADGPWDVRLKDGTTIHVALFGNAQHEKYDFVLTAQFGVVKLLAGAERAYRLVDKSPLCEQLDEELCVIATSAKPVLQTNTSEDDRWTALFEPVRTNAIADTVTPKRGLL